MLQELYVELEQSRRNGVDSTMQLLAIVTINSVSDVPCIMPSVQ